MMKPFSGVWGKVPDAKVFHAIWGYSTGSSSGSRDRFSYRIANK